MKYKIAICDDSGADRQFVLNMVRAWASSAGHTVQIDDFPSAESFLFRYAEESDYDILLLDIEMGAMDGVTMAKELRKSNDTVQIIFITGYSDYISEGYEVAALHYLMKPVKEEKLRSVLDRRRGKDNEKRTGLAFRVRRRNGACADLSDSICRCAWQLCDRSRANGCEGENDIGRA